MPFSINDPEAEALVRKLAGKTGETEEQAVVQSVRERLERYDQNGSSSEPNPGYTPLEGEALVKRLTEIAVHCASLPDFDTRSADEILGYDENGLPT